MFEEQDEKLVESLKKFWESESVGIITQDHSLHADKQKPEIHFNGHNYKNSYRLSETQLWSLHFRLKKDLDLLRDYDKIVGNSIIP